MTAGGEGLPRWRQRLENYAKARDLLIEAARLNEERALSDLEKAGFVQRYEIAWELGWKVMADYLVAQQTPPKSFTATMAIRGALAAGLIDDGDAWLAAGELRHPLSHTYSVKKRDEAVRAIGSRFLPPFVALHDTMARHADG